MCVCKQSPQCSLLNAGWCIGGGVPAILCLYLSYPFCRVSLVSCAEAVQSALSSSEGSLCRCRIDVFMEGGEFRVFLWHHLGSLLSSNTIFQSRHLIDYL